MRKELHLLLACTSLLAAMCAPALGQYGTPVQCESIIDAVGNILSPWEQTPSGTGIESAVPRFGVTDLYAYGGGAFQIDDNLSSGDSAKIFIRNVSGTAFNGVATAVIRVKTTPDVVFSGSSIADPSSSNVWSRTFVLSLYNSSLTSSRKGIGLAIRPDVAAVMNNNSTTIYGGKVWGDNTHWVKWTIVAYHNGSADSGNLKFDLYRNGVLASQLTTYTMNSSLETVVRTGYTNGFDGVYLSTGPNGGMGSWKFDYVAYKAGADPTWDPIPDTQTITGTVKDANNPAVAVPFATVSLGNGRTTTADANGVYTFSNCGPDIYTLSASGAGYFANSTEVGLPYNSPTAVHDILLVKVPDAIDTVFDTFSRSTWQELGTTEDSHQYPWDITDEVDTATVSEELLLQPKFAHGVSIGGGFLPANIDYTVDLGPLTQSVDGGDWGGIAYRQSIPNNYDSWGGQDPSQAGYLVWFPVTGQSVYLWRNGAVATASVNINWGTAHKVRVIAYGNYHEILVDGAKVLSAVDNGKLGGGYLGVFRHQADLKADNLNVNVLPDAAGLGTLSGTVYDSANPARRIAGACVTVSDGRSQVTDSLGQYSFSLNSPSRTRLTVQAGGYLDKTVEVNPVLGANTVDVGLDADTEYQASIGAVKKLAPGSTISLFGKVITANWGAALAYIEEPDRTAGIRVALPSNGSAIGRFGMSVSVRGAVELDPATNEPFIQATSWAELPVTKTGLRHLFVNGQSGPGLDITGLYVFDIGKVTSVDEANRTFTISRGGADTKVVLDPSLAITQWPLADQWVSVDGVVTLTGDSPETAVRTLKPWTGETPQYMQNPGIEQASAWGVYQGYPTPSLWGIQKNPNDGVQFAWENNDAPHGGTDCCRVVWETDRQPNVYGFFYQLPGPPPAGEWYEFSAWVRGSNVSDAFGGTNFFIDWNNPSWQLSVPAGTYDWTRISAYFTPAPGQTYMNIGLIVDNKCEYLDIDDVTIRPMRGIFTWIPGQ